MKTIKDKRKFGWNKLPKNHNCKKFGIQGGSRIMDREGLHILLFRTEGWNDDSKIPNSKLYWVIKEIKYYYDLYKDGVDLKAYIERYKWPKDVFWNTSQGHYYNTLITHIEELYNTLKLRGDV